MAACLSACTAGIIMPRRPRTGRHTLRVETGMNTPASNPSVPLPEGFRAAGVACGIKSDAARLDLSLFASDRPASAAGVFTKNRVVGAPVKVSRGRVPRATARAVVINSGNSNACTGERGVRDAEWMTAEVARELGCAPDDVLVCSTGIIGRFLPRTALERGIPAVVQSLGVAPESLLQAARGIMTTDTVPKQSGRQLDLAARRVTIAGVCKGAAMIAPRMGTMLGVILTDAGLDPAAAQQLLQRAVEVSFNAISIDGHTSTSDTVLLLANGAAGPLAAADAGRFEHALTQVCQELAQKIVRDAEGASHYVVVDVRGLRTRDEAAAIARAICEGALVKTTIAGNDPNWGRIVSAAGYAGVEFAETDVSLAVNGVPLYRAGAPVEFNAAEVSRSMAAGEVHIDLQFTLGNAAVRMWTSDLTQEYVRLNSEYTT
jgi:glutamate N-acetyltransferase/amino-acid N-acetyltransferase